MRRLHSAASFGHPSTAVALGLIFCLVTAACHRGATAEKAVVFWAMGSEAEAADSLLRGFRERYPDIPVRIQRVPWSAAHEKLLTAYVGGSMPDVFQLGNTWVAELEALGALEPLDSRVAASSDVARKDFFPGVLDANVVDGRLLALPWYVDTRLLFYRHDLLTEVGVTAPPQSWDDWRRAMQRVHDAPPRAGEDQARRFGVFLPIDEWQTPVILALQLGAALLVDDDSRGNFRSDAFRRAVEFYVGLFRDDLAPRKSEAQVANLYREFAAGYFAYFVTGPWNLVELAHRMPENLAHSWATSPMPAPSGFGPGVSVAGGASLAVSSASTRKDAAWKLVEYLSSMQAQVEFRDLSGDLPSRRDAWDRPGAAIDERAKAFRLQLDHLASTPKVPEWERVAAKITLHLERIVRGDASIDESLAALDADVDGILSKRRAMLAAGKS